jgi:hypothetical protein
MFLSFISSGLGVILGAFLTNHFNRKSKFDEMKISINLEKHTKLNRLWDSFAIVRSFLENTPNFVALWNDHNVGLIPAFRRALFEEVEAQRSIGQISFHMLLLCEYLTKYLLYGRLLGPMDVPLQITESTRLAIVERYSGAMQLMMDLIKVECNQPAIEALLYRDEATYRREMESYRKRVDKFIADHTQFEQIKKILESTDPTESPSRDWPVSSIAI